MKGSGILSGLCTAIATAAFLAVPMSTLNAFPCWDWDPVCSNCSSDSSFTTWNYCDEDPPYKVRICGSYRICTVYNPDCSVAAEYVQLCNPDATIERFEC
ncbi:MAG: hypothetical protein PWP23_3373 [Candidatus Sumerlaeota bacterium]|nr:hypothetical protein [Candidatus Sumerlaeota bacterium]